MQSGLCLTFWERLSFYLVLVYVFYSQYKKKCKLLNDIFWGVKIIDCKNDSISVALPFNKELYSKVLS